MADGGLHKVNRGATIQRAADMGVAEPVCLHPLLSDDVGQAGHQRHDDLSTRPPASFCKRPNNLAGVAVGLQVAHP